jgi:hypothetical protein
MRDKDQDHIAIYFCPMQKILSRTAIALLLLGVVGFSLFQARTILSGPSVTLAHPPEGLVSDTAFLNVTGVAENVSSVQVNGLDILVDRAGNFSEPLLLARGASILTVNATDRFGRVTTVKRTLFYRPPSTTLRTHDTTTPTTPQADEADNTSLEAQSTTTPNP